MDVHDDVGVDGDALDGDAFGAFDAPDAPDGDGLEGDGLERDAGPCGEEGRATTIEVPTISLTRSAHLERRTKVTAWSCRDCGRSHSRVSPGAVGW